MMEVNQMEFLRKILLLFVLPLICNGYMYGTTSDQPYNYSINFFEVPLDHFSYAINKTFKIRYLTNMDHVKNAVDSPILFYAGNEGDIELFTKNTGFMWELAPKLNAMLIFAEHRYYGKSLPFGEKSFDSPEYFGYLNSEQTLADYAMLLQTFLIDSRNSYKQRPIIAFGGSYGGMLAAWFRMKYPHIISGAIASSAPILQFTNLTDCNAFNRILTSVFTVAYTRDCSVNIRKSWSVIRTMASTPEGRNTLNTNFKFCTDLTKPEDVDGFFEFLDDVYGNLAMVNYPYETNFLTPLPPYPVREFCKKLASQYNDTALITALQSAISVYTNYTGKLKCLNTTSAYDESMGIKAWEIQTCTEMVMPMCTNGQEDMFPAEKWNFEKYSENCFKKYGLRPNPYQAITTYGGKHLKDASNIIFSNGLLDPWCGGGVLRSPNQNIKVIIIPDSAHHLDLRASNINDPGSVIQARIMELEQIKTWIKQL